MKAVKSDTANTIFKKDGCLDLPGTRYRYEDGTPGVETCWELTEEELERVNKERKIFVYMMGDTVPPMFLSVESEIQIN